VGLHPSSLLGFFLWIQLTRHLPQVLASVVEIDDLNCFRKVFGDQIPDPLGAIADDHLLFRQTPTPFQRFPIDAFAKPYRRFDGPGTR
jgi:hypothetical protein